MNQSTNFSKNNFPEKGHPDKSVRGILNECVPPEAFQAAIIAEIFIENKDFLALDSINIPSAPFNGSDRPVLQQIIDECLDAHPKPHYHTVTNMMISSKAKRLGKNITKVNRILFYPFSIADKYFILIALCQPDFNKRKIDKIEENLIERIALRIRGTYVLNYNDKKFLATETFIKEIGHDIASSIQSILPKLKHIAEDRYKGPLLKKKASEAMEELLSMHRTSNSIGVVIDKNYQITNFEEIDLSSIAISAKSKMESEAAEKHIKLWVNTSSQTKTIGDKAAIEIAIQHLLLNAIKYSYGSSRVVASTYYENDSVVFSVQNDSNIDLPAGDEHYYIWDFGYRSESAKEAHVNGSGIGLYTVKKIVGCHYGNAYYDIIDSDKKTISFKMMLPTKSIMKEYLKMFGGNQFSL